MMKYDKIGKRKIKVCHVVGFSIYRIIKLQICLEFGSVEGSISVKREVRSICMPIHFLSCVYQELNRQ